MKEKHYKAFISYSHKDEKFGNWLHKSLEKYKIPKELREDYPNLPKSLFPIFRDREELSVDADLKIEILKALKNSEYLIIICSVNSAKSEWVNKEIIDFKMEHGEDKVRAIILNGEPHAKDNDEFDDELECFPEALKYKVIDGKLSNVPTEPIAGDFRKGKDGREQGKLKLLAGLLAVDFDDLNRREEKRKRRSRFIWGVVAISLIAVMAGLTVYSFIQRDRALLNEQKIKEELYENILQQGLLYKNYLDNPLKAKHLLANAIAKSTNKVQENKAKIIYNTNITMNQIKLNSIDSNDFKMSKIFNQNISKNGKYMFSLDYANLKLKNLTNNKSIILKHDALITGASFSKDGKKILTSSEDYTVKLWNSIDGKLLLILKHDIDVQGAVFSEDETKILSWSEYGYHKKRGDIRLWSTKSTKPLLILKHDNPTYAVFNKDATKILSSGNNTIKLWDVKTGKLLLNLKYKYAVSRAEFSKNEKYIFSMGFYLNIMKVWNITNKIPLSSFLYDGEDIKFTKDEKYILFCKNNSIKVVNIRNNELLVNLKHIGVSEAIFSKNGEQILSWGEGKIMLWNINNNIPILVLNHKDIHRAIFNKDETKILSWGGKRGKIIDEKDKGKLKIWSTSKSKPLQVITMDAIINRAIFNINETKVLFLASQEIILWDILQKNKYKILSHNNSVNGAIYSRNEQKILSYDSSGVIKLWNLNNNKPTLILKSNTAHQVIGATFTKDEQEIVSWGLDNTIKLWSITNNKPILIYPLDDDVIEVKFSKNKKQMLSWSMDGIIKLWENNNTKYLLRLDHDGVEGIGFNQNESLILSWGKNTVKLWSNSSNIPLINLKHNYVRGAKFSKNEKQLFIWGGGKFQVYNLYENSNISSSDYPLKAEVETGSYLSKSGEIKALSKKEWLQKKKEYEQILKESNK